MPISAPHPSKKKFPCHCVLSIPKIWFTLGTHCGLSCPAKIGISQDFSSPFFCLGHAEKPDTELKWVIATYFVLTLVKIFYFRFCLFSGCNVTSKNKSFCRNIWTIKNYFEKPFKEAAAVPSRMKVTKLSPPSWSGRRSGFFSSSMSRHDLEVAFLVYWQLPEYICMRGLAPKFDVLEW